MMRLDTMVEEITANDFKEPTMIIKINRHYREGMGAEALYNTTRQWWRISLERAQRMKYALAVVNGIVLEVYQIDHWEYGGEEHDKRSRFFGQVAEERVRQRFVGKTVKALYPKGASTPTRYFG